jgi:RNA polymerase sigma factor (sigma-70 family)
MNESNLSNETEILEACLKGEAWAQRKLYELHAPAMLSVCMRYTGNYETARDLLQDGFVKVFSKLHTFGGKGAFAGWVRRVFVTTALEYLRQNDALKQYEDINDYNLKNEDISGNVLDQMTANELMECVSSLPDGYRTVFNLYGIEGYSHAEIAEMLGISENTSRSQYMRARNVLQKEILKVLGKEYVEQYTN